MFETVGTAEYGTSETSGFPLLPFAIKTGSL
jgi:hypothetical protein